MDTHPAAAPVADVPPLAPVAAAERIQALDVVRGFALAGIFLMNVEFFSRPLQDISGPGIDPALRGLDYVADAAIFLLVQNKFWTLFSLLFGMGFAVMIERARRAGRPFVPVYLRRSLALLAIGLVHALLIWSGDILVLYSLGALLLLALRGLGHAGRGPDAPMSPRGLARLGVASFALPLVLLLAMGAEHSLQPKTEGHREDVRQQEADEARERARAAAAYAGPSYAAAVGQRTRDTADVFELGNMIFQLPGVVGIFLIGMAILRSRIVEDARDHLRVLRRARKLGLPLGFALVAASTALGTAFGSDMDLRQALQIILYMLAGLVLALAYGATVVLACEGRAGGWLRRWLAPAGRMALTNYLLQSVVGTLFFYGYGLGYFGRVGRADQVAFVLVVYAIQLVLSRWWLSRFRFGPAEWVWRAATYLHLPPMRRDAGA
jgi:uncharacterized protein